MNELVTTENINPLVLFTAKAMDPLLADITKKAENFEADVSTPGGRSEIASMAHKVARSKTFLDKLGKDLNEEARQTINMTDAERRKMRDHLDALKAKVRKPLTDWEDAEEARVERHKERIDVDIVRAGEFAASSWDCTSIENLETMLTDIEAITMGEDEWQEFAGEAAEAKDSAIVSIKDAIAKREAKDAEAAELERLRLEAEDRERRDREAEEARRQQERDDEIRAEAEAAQKRADEERAAKVAEEAEERRQSAIREKDAAEEREREAERRIKEQAEQAERDRIAAEEDAEREKELAVLRERTRREDEQRAAEQAEKERAADVKHRRTINAAAKEALTQAGLSDKMAETVVTVIAHGLVPNVRITY